MEVVDPQLEHKNIWLQTLSFSLRLTKEWFPVELSLACSSHPINTYWKTKQANKWMSESVCFNIKSLHLYQQTSRNRKLGNNMDYIWKGYKIPTQSSIPSSCTQRKCLMLLHRNLFTTHFFPKQDSFYMLISIRSNFFFLSNWVGL